MPTSANYSIGGTMAGCSPSSSNYKRYFAFSNPGADHLLLNDIKDEARSKGTGKWTSQVAMDLELPATIIDSAVSMRDLSKYKALRVQLAQDYDNEPVSLAVSSQEEFLVSLEQAFYFAMINTYAQGMHLLSKASVEYSYDLNLAEIAKIWRGGCIIRSSFLEHIFKAWQQDNNLQHLLLDSGVRSLVNETLPGIRTVVRIWPDRLAIPALPLRLVILIPSAAAYAANLIQAQRDYFGAHTYH